MLSKSRVGLHVQLWCYPQSILLILPMGNPLPNPQYVQEALQVFVLTYNEFAGHSFWLEAAKAALQAEIED